MHCEKDLKGHKQIASIWGQKMLGNLYLGIICSSKLLLGKLFASQNRICPWTNILAYFHVNGDHCLHIRTVDMASDWLIVKLLWEW